MTNKSDNRSKRLLLVLLFTLSRFQQCLHGDIRCINDRLSSSHCWLIDNFHYLYVVPDTLQMYAHIITTIKLKMLLLKISKFELILAGQQDIGGVINVAK